MERTLQLALRPYVTTGVALIGASVIAVTPIAAPPPELHMPAVTLAANPVVDAYAELLQQTWTSIQTVGAQAWNQGLPILDQFLVNTGANLNILAQVPANLLSSIQYSLGEIQTTLQYAGTQFQSGDIDGGIMTLWSGLILNPVVGLVFPFLNTLEIPVTMAKTFARVVEALPTAVLLGVGFPILSSVNATVSSFATVAQNLYDGITAGDLGAVVTALLTAPATVIGGILNGDDAGNMGLINGVIAGLLNARETIADAMAPPVTLNAAAADTTLASASVTSLPTATNLVTLSLDTTEVESSKAEVTETASTTTDPVEVTTPEVTKAAEVTESTTAPEPEVTKANDATDLSDGNKVTPGEKHSDSTSSEGSESGKTDTPATSTAGDTEKSATDGGAASESAGSDAGSGAASGGDAGE
jgi:hypothetical protein